MPWNVYYFNNFIYKEIQLSTIFKVFDDMIYDNEYLIYPDWGYISDINKSKIGRP